MPNYYLQRQGCRKSVGQNNASKIRKYKQSINNISMQNRLRLKLQKQAIGHKELSQVIRLWLRDHSHQVSRDIKASITKIKEIKQEFHEKCVEYILLRKLSWIVSDYREKGIIDLSTFLKRTYQQFIVNGFFNPENTFQLFIFYYVKVVSLFLRHHFTNLLVDTKLQSEICIILYYTFLGIEVSDATYQTIQRKYLKIKFKKIKSNLNQRMFKSTKESFFQVLIKQPSKINCNRIQKTQHLILNSRQSFCKQIKSKVQKEENGIKTILREHLYVSPLPPLKQNKIRINEIQRLKTQPNIASDMPGKSLKRQSMHQEPRKQRKMYVYSNQLSNSLKSLHPQQFLFQLASKKIKINRSFYQPKDNSLPNQPSQMIHRKQLCNHSVHRQQNELQKIEHRNSIQWLGIVENLKKKVFQIRHNGTEKPRKTNYSDEQAVANQLKKENQFLQNSHEKNNDKENIPIFNINKENEDQKSKRDTKLVFVKQKIKDISESITIKEYRQNNKQSITVFHKPTEASKKDHRSIRNSISQQHQKFTNQCDNRKSSMEQQQKYPINHRWIEHRYKQ